MSKAPWKNWYWWIILPALWLVLNFVLGGSLLWKCPILEVTGLKCTGCGGQRALLEIFKGNFSSALYYNVLIPVTILYGMVYLLQLIDSPFLKNIWMAITHKAVMIILLVVVILFTILRNTAIWPWY